MNATEGVLDIKADESRLWSQLGCSAEFGDLFLCSSWPPSTKLVWAYGMFDLCSGSGGNFAERELEECLGAHDGPNRALFGRFPEGAR